MNNLVIKKMHCLLVILLATALAASAQGYDTTKFRFSNPKPLGFTITDMEFVNNSNGIAVGSDGGIAVTRNGGINWTYGAFSYLTVTGYVHKTTLSDVSYPTPDVAYVVGNGSGSSSSVYLGGMLAKTSDGGKTWNMVNNPLYANKRNINTVWFVNKDTGYIAGSWNTSDSIPKIYFTKNGGNTWDSLVSPTGTITRIGYVANPNLPPINYIVTGKAKEINRIIFKNNVGYIVGTSSLSSGGPTINTPGAVAATCLPSGASVSTLGAQHASLVWKLQNGQLTDYSVTKERLGYTGIITPVTCTSLYRQASSTQSFNTVHIVNDSMILLVSNTNNLVLRVYTGTKDSTVNVSTGIKEAGRYEIMNMTNPPTGFPTIPATNPLFSFTNPFNFAIANGKIYLPTSSPTLNPVNRTLTTVDTGRTWVEERNLPTGRNYSLFGQQAIAVTPSGKFFMGGTGGVMSDSTPGGSWTSNYNLVPQGTYNQIEFADCNNGMVVGGAAITVTVDGGKTWINKNRADFANSVYTIGGFAYPTVNKVYFAVSDGSVYFSGDQGTTLDPIYTNINYRMNDVAAIGDTIWAVGSANTTVVPVASRAPGIFRSINAGATWTAITAPFFPGSLNQTLTEVEFPSRLVGYACGSRDTIWKTTDGGITWSKLPLPTPGVTPQITYSDMQAIDDNTVILTGNGFPRSVVFKTTDGGATWQDITSNATTLKMESNIFGLIFHDANNGYLALGNGALLKTTNGGTSWSMDYAPSGGFNALGFAPKKVPAAITFQNRKLFAATSNILEYGTTANVNVNFTTTVANASCTAPSGGSITVNATGGLPPYSYSINGGAFQSSNIFASLTQGAKTITVKDAFCGISTASINVGFTNDLTLTSVPASDTSVCAGATVPLVAVAPTGSTYAWTPSTGLSATNIANPIATNNNNNVTYTVTATLNGCVKSKPVNVFIKPNPVVNAGPDLTVLIGNQVTLAGSSATAAQSIAWTPLVGLISGATTFNPIVAPIVTTKYTMTVKDVNGCTSFDDANVVVIPMCLKVMEAFTPNADGQNDVWKVTTTDPCTTNISVSVFNRYGNTVYKNNNYQNDWDGTYEGKSLPDGTYYYFIKYTLIDGKMVALKGSVTILR